MAKDGLVAEDVYTTLRGGIAEPAEMEHGTWRYRVRVTAKYVVVAFVSESTLRIVTVWRKQ